MQRLREMAHGLAKMVMHNSQRTAFPVLLPEELIGSSWASRLIWAKLFFFGAESIHSGELHSELGNSTSISAENLAAAQQKT
jgi:hypothetical protein